MQLFLRAIITVSICVAFNHSYAQTAADFSGVNGGSIVIGHDSRDCGASLRGSMRYSASTNPGTNGLVAHWTLDEASGTFADSSGNGHTGTQTGGVTYGQTGQVGDAVGFDSTDDQIAVADDADFTFDPSQSYTWMAWIKASGVKDWGTVFSQTIDSGNYLYIYAGQTASGGFTPGGGVTNGVSFWYSRDGGNESQNVYDAEGVMNYGTWQHVAVTYDGSITARADRVEIYVDGALRTTGSYIANNDYSTFDPTYIEIGANAPYGETFNGDIDDVKFYNRVLSEPEIHGAAGAAGSIQLCKERIATYALNAVTFDGSDRLLRGGALTGVSDGKTFTISLWIRVNGAADWQRIFSQPQQDGSDRFTIGLNDSDQLVLSFTDPTDSIYTNMYTDAGINDGNWHHVLFSYNSSFPVGYVYVDGVPEGGVGNNPATDTVYDFTPSPANWGVGADTGAGAWNPFDGDLADFWVDFETFIDFSQLANRRKFIDAAGNPVDLGTAGETPTGSSPDVFLSGATANWHTNKGTGGGFTEDGTLTDASTAPAVTSPYYDWVNWGE